MNKLERTARFISRVTGAPLPFVVGDLIALRGALVGFVVAIAILIIMDLTGVF